MVADVGDHVDAATAVDADRLVHGEVEGHDQRLEVRPKHVPPAAFRPGTGIKLALAAPGVASARLWYRRMNQAERWQSRDMERGFSAEIPADYTQSPYAIEYYFELRRDAKSVALYPGFAPEFNTLPYFVVTQA